MLLFPNRATPLLLTTLLGRRRFRRIGTLLLIASISGLSMAGASDSTDPSPAAVESRADQASQPGFPADTIPAYLVRLQLSDKQQEQIKRVIQDYDQSIHEVWKQFSQRYFQTIAVECSLLAAIEDNFTEQQRLRIRELRRRTAQQETSATETESRTSPTSAKPSDPVEKAIEGVGITLTPEQEAIAEKVEEKYRYRLRSLNREIHRFHARLLSLEADKLVAIEKLLTRDQLSELRQSRRNKPDDLKHSGLPGSAPETDPVVDKE
ncbi:hypothetical protein [Schlesneria sp. T3-172]|uniref:hypothetical protein n=1 Tax=Schlesneria sphaerica TaxID=3373610 RepID=UPI0037C674A9